MTRDETVALFLQGREAWNKWANGMLAERKRLQDAGVWAEGSDLFGKVEPQSEETRQWSASAKSDFAGYTFIATNLEDNADLNPNHHRNLIIEKKFGAEFTGFIFPHDVTFHKANMKGSAWFDATHFCGEVSFEDVRFRDAYFDRAIFRGRSFFDGAVFAEQTSFDFSYFHSPAFFIKCNFAGRVTFEDVVFEEATRFTGAKFSENNGKADFFQATFKRFVTFRDARFFRKAQFTAISAERAFDLRGTTFDQLPDFTQANFREAPRLDNLKLGPKVEPGGFWRSLFSQTPAADDVIANYRSLRRLAIQAHDHANEQKFLKGEIRTRRNGEDKIWHFAWWSGVLYDAISDFGRSMARPLWIWVLSAAGFAALYLALSVNGIDAPACAPGNPGSPVLDALYLAYKNALLVIGWESEQKLNQVHACLYGQPQAPSGIALIQLGQNLISAAVLFLLLLGVRNRFKIK